MGIWQSLRWSRNTQDFTEFETLFSNSRQSLPELILRNIKSGHTILTCSFKIHFKITIDDPSKSPKQSLSFGHTLQMNMFLHFTHARYMPLQSHSSWFHLPNNILWMSTNCAAPFAISSSFLLLPPSYVQIFKHHLRACSFRNVRKQSFTLLSNIIKIIFLHISILRFFIGDAKATDYEL